MAGGTRWLGAMRDALAEAERAAGHGDVPIGAVVVDAAGTVIARAGNERELTGDPTAHAEILALRRAADVLRERSSPAGADADPADAAASQPDGWRLGDCTLVVTLEPCTMCAGAVVNARLARLVFGAFDPKAGAVSSLRDVVRDPRLNHRTEVTAGVLADECGALLRDFFARRRPE